MGFALFGQPFGAQRDDGQDGECRADGPKTKVFRQALIRTDHLHGLCLVRSLSSKGMLAKVYSPIATSTPVTTEFGEHVSIAGVVARSEHRLIDVRFNDPVNVAELLAEVSKKSPGNNVNRSLRLEIDVSAEVELDGHVEPIELEDVSLRGVRAKVSRYCLATGDEVLVRLNGLETRKAVVRWALAGLVGLNFIRPLGMDELAEWVVRLQTS